MFRGPDLIAKLSDGLKIMDPGFITCDDIDMFLETFEAAFCHFNPLRLCSSVNRCGTHLAEIFLSDADCDMPTFRAIS